jgi:hypothetical protein
MTQQQMIDFWQNQIQGYKAEYSNEITVDLKRLHELDVLIKQAELIFMQLITMELTEAITSTSVDFESEHQQLGEKNFAEKNDIPALNNGDGVDSYNDGVFHGIKSCNADFQVLLQQLHNYFSKLKRINKRDMENALSEFSAVELGEDANPFLEEVSE